MIHEVMVLDHSGVDLAYIQYGASVKLWVLGGLFSSMLVPKTGVWLLDLATGLVAVLAVGVITGIVESVMAGPHGARAAAPRCSDRDVCSGPGTGAGGVRG